MFLCCWCSLGAIEEWLYGVYRRAHRDRLYFWAKTGKPLDEVDVEHLEVKDEDENEEDTDIPPICEGNLHYPGAKVDVN